MSGYLKKFVKQYRVKADYDLDTKDYPRLENGCLDPSFDDLYIDCRNNIQIRHGVGNVLSCYVPSKSRGLNILRKIYQDKISETLPKEKGYYFENLCSELVKNEVLVSAEVLDFEIYFEFKATTIDYIADIVGAKTNGASINPFSNKNLPKKTYKIPEEDIDLYKESIENLPKITRVLNGKPVEMTDGTIILKLNKQFDDVIIKSKSKGFDINKDRKSKGLRGKEYYHSLGEDMWKQYCNFLKAFTGE